MADAACGEPTEGTPAADGHLSADAGGEPTQGTPAADGLLVADVGAEPTHGTPAAVVLTITDPQTDAPSAPNVFSRFLRVVAGLRPFFRA